MQRLKSVKPLDLVLGSGLLYCGYKLGKVALMWPEPCKVVMELVKTNEEASTLLGSNVRAGFMWDGNFQSEEHNRSAQGVSLKIPVTGSAGKGMVWAKLVHTTHGWEVLTCEIDVERDGILETKTIFAKDTFSPKPKPQGQSDSPTTGSAASEKVE